MNRDVNYEKIIELSEMYCCSVFSLSELMVFIYVSINFIVKKIIFQSFLSLLLELHNKNFSTLNLIELMMAFQYYSIHKNAHFIFIYILMKSRIFFSIIIKIIQRTVNDNSALTQPFFFIASKQASIKRFSTPRIRKIFNERRNFVVLSPENE